MKKLFSIMAILGQIILFSIPLVFFFFTRMTDLNTFRYLLTGLMVTGFLLLFGGLIGRMALHASQNSALNKNGILAIGTVVHTKPTGTRINNQPEIELQLSFKDREGITRTGITRNILSITDLALAVPGALFPLKYDPAVPEHIALLKGNIDPAVLQAEYNEILIRDGITTPEFIDIAVNGIQTQAVVAGMTPTGKIIKSNPEIEVALKVRRIDGSSYDAVVTKVFLPQTLKQISIGAVVDVAYYPENEQRIAFRTRLG